MGRFRDGDGTTLDSGLLLYFPAPHSFTGEDVLELHGHGGPVVLDLILAAILAAGARQARPGEFSERAFLNGKLDLAQAEAIADLIAANTEAAARSATRSLEGELSARVTQCADLLVELRAFVEASIDFPDEELELLNQGQIVERIQALRERIDTFQQSVNRGVLLTEGLRVALAGEPNAGKSSLLNSLTGTDSALVTPVAGTTRDIIRESINIDGMPLQLLDTAGIRETDDLVERLGAERALDASRKADLVVLVCDSTNPGPLPEALGTLSAPVIKVNNKIDLSGLPPGAVAGRNAEINISALTGAGMDALRGVIKSSAGYVVDASAFSARRRHIHALDATLQAIARAEHCIVDLQALELAAEELREAHTQLQTITGAFTTEDLLGEIFSSFCIGK